MAEVVEYRVDKTLPELKVLVDFGIFNADHAKEIIKKREIFEYNLRRRTKTKLDYLRYIRFEMNLLDSIEKLKTNMLKQTESMDDELERKILRLQAKKLQEIVRSRVNHISFLYRRLVNKYRFDKRLWKAYIEFAKQRKLNTRVSALYWRLLRVAGTDESIWIEAAQHEIHTNQDINTARKLFLVGIRHHPKSVQLLSALRNLHDPNKDVVAMDTPVETTPLLDEPQEDQHKQSMMENLYECYESKGLDETRKLYQDLERKVKNQKLSLYVGMIQIETCQLAKDKSEQQLARISDIYEKALSKYGKHKAKLWYEYITFLNQNSKTLEDIDRISRIRTRAAATLTDPAEAEKLFEKFHLLQVTSDKTNVEYSDYSDLD